MNQYTTPKSTLVGKLNKSAIKPIGAVCLLPLSFGIMAVGGMTHMAKLAAVKFEFYLLASLVVFMVSLAGLIFIDGSPCNRKT